MSSIRYIKATSDHVQVLVENRIAFAKELAGTLSEDMVTKLKGQMSDYFHRATLDDSYISFIAMDNTTVAGIGSVHLREMPGNVKNPSGKWGYIMNMYTVPAYRRKGICKAILNALTEEAGRYGITAFELHATEEGEKVYVQEGFIKHQEPTYRKVNV